MITQRELDRLKVRTRQRIHTLKTNTVKQFLADRMPEEVDGLHGTAGRQLGEDRGETVRGPEDVGGAPTGEPQHRDAAAGDEAILAAKATGPGGNTGGATN